MGLRKVEDLQNLLNTFSSNMAQGEHLKKVHCYPLFHLFSGILEIFFEVKPL